MILVNMKNNNNKKIKYTEFKQLSSQVSSLNFQRIPFMRTKFPCCIYILQRGCTLHVIMKYAILCFHPFSRLKRDYARIHNRWSKRKRRKRSPKNRWRNRVSNFRSFRTQFVQIGWSAFVSFEWPGIGMKNGGNSFVEEVTRSWQAFCMIESSTSVLEEEDSSYPRAIFKGCAPFYTSTIFSFFGALLTKDMLEKLGYFNLLLSLIEIVSLKLQRYFLSIDINNNNQ